MFGPVPCVVEDIEFQKFLILDQGAAPSAQVASIRPRANSKCACAPTLRERLGHARARLRQALDRASAGRRGYRPNSRRCPSSLSARRSACAACRVRILLRPNVPGNRAAVAERAGSSRRDPRAERRTRASFRLSIAPRDPGRLLSDLVAGLAGMDELAGQKGDLFVPMKIERVRFHATPPTSRFHLTAW